MFAKSASIQIPSDNDTITDDDSQVKDDSHEKDKNIYTAKVRQKPDMIPNEQEETNNSKKKRKKKNTNSKQKKATNVRVTKEKNKVRKTTSTNQDCKINDKLEVRPTLVEDDKEDSESNLTEVCTFV